MHAKPVEMGIIYYSSDKDGASCNHTPATAETCSSLAQAGCMALPWLLQGAGAPACKSDTELCSLGQNSKTEHAFKLREILHTASALCPPI